MRLLLPFLLIATAAPAQTPAADSTWQQHDAAADAALAHGDYHEYLHQLRILDPLLSGHPGVVYGIARAHALLGARDSALAWLDRYARMGLLRDISRDSAFSELRGTPAFARIAARLAANGDRVGSRDLVLALPDSTLLIEDIARDPRTGIWYLSSVHQRRILQMGRDGVPRDLVPSGGSGLLVPFAIALDTTRNLLWVTSAGTPDGEGISEEQLGRTGVLGFDLATGRPRERYDLPADGTRRALADLDLLDDGSLVVSDSRGGGVYRLEPGRGLALLVPPGTFKSPQGPAGIPGTPYVLVADYVRGIARVNRLSGEVSWMPHPPDLAANGIDGLRLRGRRLVAVQNGLRPARVIEMTLDTSLARITGWRVLAANLAGLREPTHGLVQHGDFVFVANSGWADMGDDGRFREGAVLQRPEVWRVATGE